MSKSLAECAAACNRNLNDATREQWRRRALGRTAEKWREAILRIADAAMQGEVASVVWWDFYSLRPAGAHKGAMDDLRDRKPGEFTRAEVAKALVQVGYYRAKAWERARVEMTEARAELDRKCKRAWRARRMEAE